MNTAQNKKTVLASSAAALLAALMLLIGAVLPAEYGWDPLGTGAALGLTGMSGEGNRPLTNHALPWQQDQRQFQLAPFEAVEFKYRLQTGAVLLYSWQAQGEVLFDMHAEPDGAAPGYAESFEKSRAAQRQGSYVAPFDGIHGWFWQNRTQQHLVITLRVHGFFSSAKEMRDGHELIYELSANGDNPAPSNQPPDH